MPGIEWISTLDHRSFVSSMNEMAAQVRQTKNVIDAMGMDASTAIKQMSSAGREFVGTLKEIGAVAGVSFSIAQAKSFVDKIVETRGYFQDIESSMKVFLGNEEKARDFTDKLKSYAYYNMFEFSDLANASKQMIAYGHNVDTIIPRLDQLSNVARGTSAPLMEMVNAYNRAKNLGGVGARDLQSWAAKGLVVKDILKEMGEKVKGTTVTFEQLNKVLDHVTGEGGMFHNLMGEQLNNITAEQGQLEDNLTAMYDEIGEKYQDTITEVIKAESWLVEHYKEVGTVIMSLIAAYGEYRAALIATDAFKNVQRKTVANLEIEGLDKEIEKYKELLPEKEKAKNADLAEAVAKGKLTEEQSELIAAKRAELEQVQIEKELLGVDEKINELKRLKLDEDLQDKVATEQLTLAQAQEVQQRREVLRSLDEEISKRKEAELAKIAQTQDKNDSRIDTTRDTISRNNAAKQGYEKDIENIDKEISQFEILGDKEVEINDLRQKRQELIEKEAQLNDANIGYEEKIEQLKRENVELDQRSFDIRMRYGTDEEKLNQLNEMIGIQKEELTVAQDDAQKKQQAYEQVLQTRLAEEEKLRVLKEQLETQQAINRERSERGEASNDLSELNQQVDDQQAIVDELNNATQAKEENSLATAAQEAAEKAQNIQEQINTLEEQANSIATGTNTKAKAGNSAATNALTVSEKIHNAALIAGTTASKIFTTAVKQVKVAIKGLGAAIMTNPIGVLVGALTIGLPWLMEWVSGTDDAAEMEERYGNEAKEAESKVESLINVIKTADANSKTYKDSVSELERIYKDYGIEIEKTKDAQGKEITNVQALIDHHGKLVDVLRQEAIERQKNNDMEGAAKTFEDAAEEATKSFKKRLDGDVFSLSDKNAIANLVNEENVRKAGEEMQKYQQIIQRLEETYGSLAYRQPEAREQQARLNVAMAEAAADAKGYAAAITDDEEALKDANTNIEVYVRNLALHKAEQIKANGAAEEAAVRAWKVSDANAKAARDIRYAKMSTSELKRELEMLVLAYKDTRLNVTIDFNQVNVPKWMKGMDLNKLKQQASFWTAQAVDMGSKGQSRRIIGGKEYNINEVAERGYQYDKAAMDAEDKQASAEAEKRRGEEEAAKHADRMAKDAANRRKKIAELDRKQAEEQSEQQKRTQAAINKATIAGIQDNAERERAEQEEQYRLNRENIEKLEEDYRKKNLDLIKARWEANNKDNSKHYEDTDEYKAYMANPNSIRLSEDQQKEINARRNEAEANYNRIILERYRNEAQAMRDYLKEYGSYEQQRLAITEEYEQKIREAKTEGEKLRLQEEYKQAQSNLELTNIMGGIDWSAVFGGVENMTTDMMKVLSEQLRAWQQSPEYESSDATTKQQVAQILADIRQYVGSDMSVTWKTLATDIDNFNNAVTAFNEAREAEKPFVEAYEEARRKEQEAIDTLNKMISGGASEEDVNEQQGIVDSLKEETQAVADAMKPYSKATADAKKSVDQFGHQVNTTTDELKNQTPKWLADFGGNEAWRNVDGYIQTNQSFRELQDISNTIKTILPEMEDGIGKNVMEGISTGVDKMGSVVGGGIGSILESGIGQVIGILVQIPKLILQIVDAIKKFVTGVLDGIKELLEFEWLSDLVNSILESIGNLVQAVFDLPANLAHAIYSIVVDGVGGLLGSIGNAITYGGLDSWLGNRDNHEKMLEIQEDANFQLDLLNDKVGRISDKLDKSYGAEAIKTYDELQEYIASMQEQYERGVMAAGDDKYGGKHMEWYHRNKNGGEGDNGYVARLKDAFGLDFKGTAWQDFFDYIGSLPDNGGAKILSEIRESNGLQDVWAELMRTNSYDHGAIADWVKRWADSYDETTNAMNQLKEQLTTTTLDNVFDDYLDSLYDLADGSEEVFDNIADDWQKMVNRMVINNFLTKETRKRLEEWYEDLSEVSRQAANGEMDEKTYNNELERLKKEYREGMEADQREIERLREMGIIAATGENSEYKQEASSKGFQAMSQDTGEELNGRFTALQIAGESINAQMMIAVTHLEQMTALHVGTNTYLGEMRELAVTRNSYLEDIAKYSKQMYLDFSEKMDDLVTNTKKL